MINSNTLFIFNIYKNLFLLNMLKSHIIIYDINYKVYIKL
jgi:hypothetical protein